MSEGISPIIIQQYQILMIHNLSWFLDGTFKSSLVQFMELCAVHRLTNHRNIVGAYALFPNKRRATYVEMITEAPRLTYNAMPQSLMTDFEPSMLSELNQIYPGIL